MAKTSVINLTLTTFAVGIAQDNESQLAEFIAPSVPTGVAHGQYKTFSKVGDFKKYKTERAMGGARRRIEFSTDDKFFNCQPHGIEIPIDDHEIDLVGENGVIQLEEAKITTLVNEAIVSREMNVFSKVKAAKAATAGAGVWSNDAKDPIAEIDAEIAAIVDSTKMQPNRMVIDFSAWVALRKHPKVLERIAGIKQSFSLQDLKDNLVTSNIEIKLATLTDSKDTPQVFIFLASQNPTPYDPSFAKTFMTRKGGVDKVVEYRDESHVSEMKAVDWTEDVKVTSSISGRRISIS